MTYWFTADYHLGHANIIGYVGRPFHSLQHMNRVIISNHNQRVKEDDIVFHIGDFCFKGNTREIIRYTAKEYKQMLNGSIIFLRGNHDNNNGLKTIIDSIIIEHGGYQIYMNHWPENAEDSFPLNFCGHIHANWKCRRLSSGSILVNVGVDVWDYRPISIEQILQYLNDNGYKIRNNI